MPPRFVRPSMTLEEAQEWLEIRLGKGAHCPCCHQFAKDYHRQVNAQLAYALVVLAANTKHGQWVHWPSLSPRYPGVDLSPSKLKYWDLVEEHSDLRPDGGRAGWWRVTFRGRAFVRGTLSIPKYAIVYDTEFFGHDGPMVTIQDCLKKKFDLRELMDGI